MVVDRERCNVFLESTINGQEGLEPCEGTIHGRDHANAMKLFIGNKELFFTVLAILLGPKGDPELRNRRKGKCQNSEASRSPIGGGLASQVKRDNGSSPDSVANEMVGLEHSNLTAAAGLSPFRQSATSTKPLFETIQKCRNQEQR